MNEKKILIATGGTGGHIIPAYSLAKFLLSKDFKVELTTDTRGLRFLKNNKDLKIAKIKTSTLNKSSFLKLIFSISIILFSIISSIFFLIFNRPSIIFGMGGYSSFPICIAAFILRIKFVIYENNLIIGKANKYLLPFTKKIFVSYKDLEGVSEKYKNKIHEIGNILREEIIHFSEKNYVEDKFDKINILVLGGSQAAKVFAENLPEIFKDLRDSNIPFKIIQQCQKNQNNQLSQYYQSKKIDFEIFNFTNEIIDYYSKSNLVITRSGASVLGELINMKIPFISIPLPSSADNHQLKNAKFYVKRGYGYLLEEKDVKNKLNHLIKSLFEDKFLTKNILFNQRQYSDKNVFRNLYIQIEKILNEKN
tara:strand:- start:377 stop:1471 length:1095 start_codon:yes stop_codon:yes gene_type:complete